MDLPISLPKELMYAGKAVSADELLNLLLSHSPDIIPFFEVAADDEIWRSKHSTFMQSAIEVLTRQYYEDKLKIDLSRRLARAIQEHFDVLKSDIPRDLIARYNGSEQKINSLLWGAGSSWLHTLIRSECIERNKTVLVLGDVLPDVFHRIEEYIETGTVSDLWRQEPEDIFKVLDQASRWGIVGLVAFCEDNLKHYITTENAVTYLLKAHEAQWPNLRQESMNFINALDVGIFFDQVSISQLSFEFLTFSEDALEIFEQFRFHITHLVCGHNLIDLPTFSDIITRCPKLVYLDISRTNTFSERLFDIPSDLSELNISKCGWLNPKTMRKMFEICPHLTALSLASNTQLDYSCWGLMRQLNQLKKLNLSRCYQINDQDFRVILQACHDVTNFYLQGCIGLTDLAFFELAKVAPKVAEIDISRCNIYDGALVDLSVRCKQLVSLDLTRCTTISDRGVIETVRNAANLQTLNISMCKLPPETIQKIREIRPFLNVIGA